MMTALLIVIFVTFIGVGLPDSVLGTAWPAIYPEFGLPISLAGYLTVAVSACTTLSSLFSARLIRRFGTGMVAAVSTLMTALALLGYALSPHPMVFFLLAIPLGLGAGSIDTALNAFVALHYSAARMSFLHCFYGLGVSASPFIMSLALGPQNDWRRGYLIVAAVQFGITAVAFLALPLWRRAEQRDLAEGEDPPAPLSFRQLMRMPNVRISCLAFLAACGLELTAGSWSSSYFVNTKGVAVDDAARLAMLFYIGLAAGRFLSGVLSGRLGRRQILRLSLWVLLGALAAFLLPLPLGISAAALFLIGLGVGPIYPNLVHLTPKFFGEDAAQAVMGVQQAASYVGVMLMPWLFGVLAQGTSTAVMPGYLLAQFAAYAAALLKLFRDAKKAPAKTTR